MKGHLPHYFEFGPFRLDLTERSLSCNGKLLQITPKAFETLLVLVQNAGRVVDKKEILQEVWPETFVGEATLAQNISTLRRVLGENSKQGQYIQTVTKRGYRLVADVREVRGEGAAQAAEEQTPTRGPAEQVGAPPQDAIFDSLAILPFTNLTNDPEAEYLSDGITESIIHIISQISELKVMARSVVLRYKEGGTDPQDIGRQLKVRAVMMGRVIQFGNKLIIRTELVDVANGWLLWGEQFEREISDVLTVQIEMANRIAEKLKLKLHRDEPKLAFKKYTQNADAYYLYLKGRYRWNKHTERDYVDAINYFEQAIEIDPNFALAYSGIADAHILRDFYGFLPPWEVMPKAKAAAMKALAIDDRIAEGHTSLACIKMLYEYDWAGAEREFQRAIELNVKYDNAHQWYSHYLLAVGRFEKALDESKKSLEIDPLSVNSNLHLGWYYLYTRDYTKAIKQLQEVIKIESHFWPSHVLLGIAYEQNNMLPEAIAEMQTARDLEATPLISGILGHAYGVAERRDEANRLLNELKELSKQTYVPPYSIAIIHTGLGENDQAFQYLEKAYAARNQWLGWLMVDPELDGLRSDPRFKELVNRMGLSREKP